MLYILHVLYNIYITYVNNKGRRKLIRFCDVPCNQTQTFQKAYSVKG